MQVVFTMLKSCMPITQFSIINCPKNGITGITLHPQKKNKARWECDDFIENSCPLWSQTIWQIARILNKILHHKPECSCDFVKFPFKTTKSNQNHVFVLLPLFSVCGPPRKPSPSTPIHWLSMTSSRRLVFSSKHCF